MELVVYKIDGSETTKKVKLDDSIYGIEPNDHAIYLDVKQILANKRHGTHSAKEKSDLTGSTRKIKRQKGTGGARAGSIKNPLFKGGARVFGPRPRDYGFKLNKNVKQLARKSALSYKLKENNIKILEDFSFETPKTKNCIKLLENFNLKDKKTLLVLPKSNNNVYLSSRNIENIKIVLASTLNTYEILNANSVIIVESSVKEIDGMFKN